MPTAELSVIGHTPRPPLAAVEGQLGRPWRPATPT